MCETRIKTDPTKKHKKYRCGISAREATRAAVVTVRRAEMRYVNQCFYMCSSSTEANMKDV